MEYERLDVGFTVTVAPETVTPDPVTENVWTVELSDVFFNVMFFPETAMTFSEKTSEMLALNATFVALSTGFDDARVGAVVSAPVVKFKAVEDEMPAYANPPALINAPESTTK